MINTITTIFKYSALVLTVLVLSHIVQIKGTTISQHVENGMNWISGSRPRASVTKVTQSFSSAIRSSVKDTDDISPSDREELNAVIHSSNKKHGLIK